MRITRSQARLRLVALFVLNIALIVCVPGMARSKGALPPYEGQLICGSISIATLVISVGTCIHGSTLHRVLLVFMCLLPGLVIWDIFKHGIPTG